MENEERSFEPQQEFTPYPEEQIVTPVQTVADKVLPALKDPLFLVICILMSVFCLTSLSLGNLPLIEILATVFLWLTYAQAYKDVVDTKHLRSVSGTIYAQYVITYVVAGLLLVMGIICAVVFSFVMQDPDLAGSIQSAFLELDDTAAMLSGLILAGSGIIVMVVFVICAGLAVIANIFITRYIHQFVKSVYTSVDGNDLQLKHVTAAKVCLFIISGCSGISALSALPSMTEMLNSAATCATTLIAGLLIRKYFSCEKPSP